MARDKNRSGKPGADRAKKRDMKRIVDSTRGLLADPRLFVGRQYSSEEKKEHEVERWKEYDRKIEKDEEISAIAAAVAQAIGPVEIARSASESTTMSDGERCCKIQDEMKAIRNKYLHGKTVAAIREANPEYLVWGEVDGLDQDERETFHHPRTWEAGYIDAFLGRRYERAPSTIIDWKKKHRKSLRKSRLTPSHSK